MKYFIYAFIMKTSTYPPILLFFLFIVAPFSVLRSQETLYFPPVIGDDWETISSQSLGWCDENIPQLYDYLEKRNTKAFIV
ncbi:MAG TPA: hypothetical protein PKE52_16245, partial [Bacteroidales bacterium]|nr:hypothetical protein [Bacteroidales bacterium]